MLSSRFKENSKTIFNLSKIQKKHLDIVNKKLIEGEYNLIDDLCVCEDTNPNKIKKISEVDRYGINLKTVFCLNCGSTRINPYLDNDSLKSFYEEHYQELYARYENIDKYFKKQTKYASDLEQLLKQKSIKFDSIFEIGCGAGGALDYFFKKKYKVGGSEYSKELLEYIKNTSLKDFIKKADEVQNYNFDIIYLHHVFEHVADPINYINNLKNKMNDESKIILTIPDYSRIDKFKYPAGDFMYYIHIAHKFNYSYKAFEYICEKLSLNLDHIVPSKYKSEFTVILSKNKNNIYNHNIKFEDPQKAFDNLIKTEIRYKYYFNKGQLTNLHVIILRKLYGSFPEIIKKIIKRIFKK